MIDTPATGGVLYLRSVQDKIQRKERYGMVHTAADFTCPFHLITSHARVIREVHQWTSANICEAKTTAVFQLVYLTDSSHDSGLRAKRWVLVL